MRRISQLLAAGLMVAILVPRQVVPLSGTTFCRDFGQQPRLGAKSCFPADKQTPGMAEQDCMFTHARTLSY